MVLIVDVGCSCQDVHDSDLTNLLSSTMIWGFLALNFLCEYFWHTTALCRVRLLVSQGVCDEDDGLRAGCYCRWLRRRRKSWRWCVVDIPLQIQITATIHSTHHTPTAAAVPFVILIRSITTHDTREMAHQISQSQSVRRCLKGVLRSVSQIMNSPTQIIA